MNSRPGRHLFDPAITQPQCRWPCEVREHVHDGDLPSNLGYRDGLPGDEDSTNEVR